VYADIDDVLARDGGDFIAFRGRDLLARVEPYHNHRRERERLGLWPYERTNTGEVGPTADLAEAPGTISFGFQDSLGLASHESVRQAGVDAIHRYGPHSASAPFWQGRHALADATAEPLRQITGCEHLVFFPTGWASAHATIQALVRPWDRVLYDSLCHSSLMFGINAATRRTAPFRHNDVAHARERLASIRSDHADCAILVVTESTFSVDADYPDLAALQSACHEYGATLLVDASHDIGAMGPGGTGQVGLAGLHGKVDLLIGAFSKTFAFTGGFLATRSPAVADYVRMMGSAQMFSNAITPVALAVVGAAARIVVSAEGDERRARLRRNVSRLRYGMATRGMEISGMMSPLVPVHVAPLEVAYRMGGELLARGVSANFVEFPAVPRGTARFRFQVMSEHTPEQIDRTVAAFAEALEFCRSTPLVLDLTSIEAQMRQTPAAT